MPEGEKGEIVEDYVGDKGDGYHGEVVGGSVRKVECGMVRQRE